MLKMFKIPLYTIILLLFSFTAHGAEICGDPNQREIEATIVVGKLKGNVCQNYDTFQVFRAIRNDTIKASGYTAQHVRWVDSPYYSPAHDYNSSEYNTHCTRPGAVCKFVGSVGCGVSTIGECDCPITFTRCTKTLQQNRSQNMQKNQFKRQRGTFSGK